MDIVQCLDLFNLDDHTTLNQEICDKIPDQYIFVTNFDSVLLGNLKASLPKFYSKRIFVDLFKKSGAEDITNLMHAADDFLCNLIQP